MNIWRVFMLSALCSWAYLDIKSQESGQTETTKGTETNQTSIVVVSGVDVETGGNLTISTGSQSAKSSAEGTEGGAQTSDQRASAQFPMGPGGEFGAGGTGALAGGAALGAFGGELAGEAEYGGGYGRGRGERSEMIFEGGSSRHHKKSGSNENPEANAPDLESLLQPGAPGGAQMTEIDISADVTTGTMQKIDTSKVNFETLALNDFKQISLPAYSDAQIKSKINKGISVLKAYTVVPTQGRAFEYYRDKLKKQLKISVLITLQEARDVVLDGLKKINKEVKSIDGKPVLELVVYRQTPREKKGTGEGTGEWKEVLSVVQSTYDSNLAALFKVDDKAWLYIYFSKIGVPTVGVIGKKESLPLTLPAAFNFTKLNAGSWKNKVKTTTIGGYDIAGYQFGPRKILLIGKDLTIAAYVKKDGDSDWRRIAVRGSKFISNPLSKSGYYIEIQDAAKNGFLNLYDSMSPDLIYKLATRELQGKNLTWIR